MAPYLPSEGRQRGAYSEGGALFALGLIHANHGYDIREFLLESLTGSQNEASRPPCILSHFDIHLGLDLDLLYLLDD